MNNIGVFGAALFTLILLIKRDFYSNNILNIQIHTHTHTHTGGEKKERKVLKKKKEVEDTVNFFLFYDFIAVNVKKVLLLIKNIS